MVLAAPAHRVGWRADVTVALEKPLASEIFHTIIGWTMNALTDLAIFRDLPPDALAELERGARRAEFRDGAVIFARDDPPDAVYAILAGPGHVRIGSMNRRAKMLM